ncbi:GtrA-like protein [compost metagenome]
MIGFSSVLLLFNVCGFNYWVSSALGNTIAILMSFFLNRRFTFGSNTQIKKSIVRFMIVAMCSYIIAYPIGYFAGYILKDIFKNHVLIDNLSIIISSGLYTLIGFVGHRKFTFS